MTTIDKIIPEGQIIHVFGSIDGVKIKTSGQAFPYLQAKSPAHAQRYAERLLVNAALSAERPHLDPDTDRFVGPVELQAFQDAYEGTLRELESRIAKLERPWWEKFLDFISR
jgi:hypothetical protein